MNQSVQHPYVKCGACGIVRNSTEAPECPVCRDKGGVNRRSEPRPERKIVSPRPKKYVYCDNCQCDRPVVKRKANFGTAIIDHCGECDEPI